MIIRLTVFLVLIAAAVAQISPAMMAMMSSRSGGSGGSGGAAGGSSGGLASMMGGMMGGMGGGMGMMGGMGAMMNNPVWLCRRTENLKMVPCANFKQICDYISFTTYNMPSVLSCSPMGMGCCIKDAMTYMLLQRMG